MPAATAVAHSNIALAKYWGKADVELNLPAVPSVSMTLDGMSTTTRVALEPELGHDVLILNGNVASGRPLARATALLERVRREAGSNQFARVESHNDFPTASGLASSASGFAALALAARGAYGLPDDRARASSLARQSSASAARSVFGGYVALDVSAAAARRVASPDHFPLELVVAVTREGAKDTSSTLGMEHTRSTSPYYTAWLEHAPGIAARIERAVSDADFGTLGPLVEQSALLMHASMWGAAPAVMYFTAATLEVVHRVHELRRSGIPAFYTMDAGPHVKVISQPEHAPAVRAALDETAGVLRTIHCRLGHDATLRVEAA